MKPDLCTGCGAYWEDQDDEQFRLHAWNCPNAPAGDSPTEWRLAESGAV